ncbi:MAG: hypothetical protein KGL39_27385 [Patescibacteria group bacterium]|nr:hypothetical protein [Patescibacteria group bacterium]
MATEQLTPSQQAQSFHGRLDSLCAELATLRDAISQAGASDAPKYIREAIDLIAKAKWRVSDAVDRLAIEAEPD